MRRRRLLWRRVERRGRSVPNVEELTQELHRLGASRLAARETFIVGVTGGVAAGKSTLAAALERTVRAWPEAPDVEVVCTDGFLHPNNVLEKAGLSARKGFPESYDAEAFRTALIEVRLSAAIFPGYSHLVYDVDPASARRLSRPGVLIVEGLGFAADTPVDTLVYVDADEADLEAWYVARFLGFCAAGRADPTTFYAGFAHLDDEQARGLARSVWMRVNLPNIRENVAPLCDLADIVVRKRADHVIESVEARGGSG